MPSKRFFNVGWVAAAFLLGASGLAFTYRATDVAPSTSSNTANAHSALPTSGPRTKTADPERVRRAVDKGLTWLRRAQDKTTGAWVENIGYKLNSEFVVTEASKPHVGVTSLALMAFLSGGHLPGRGQYADVVERGIDFVLSSVDAETGYISRDGTRMYSHAFATLLLAEVYGMTHREDLKEKLQRAVDVTVKSQNSHGSWRYLLYSSESDMSITVCQIMALRAARNKGIRVPKTVIDRAYDYVVRSAYKNPASPEYGGFKYQEKDRSRTSFALTSAGVATLYHSGVYEHQLIQAGLQYLRNEIAEVSRHYGGRQGHYFYWYGHYYACQVFFMAGNDNADLWQFYWDRMSRELPDNQEADGSWNNLVGPGPAFSTAVASIILQIPNQYLPILHR
ncbi:MAG: prenyltransferase [Planctomycetes bacterium]|nr:prenyltransferase [Planctomycetota bacterium]